VQIWKDDKGRVNFQIGYQLLETWVKKVYGQHTQPRYTRLTKEQLAAEGLADTTIAYRCEFIMCSDLKAMSDMAAIVGSEEALRMFTCVGIGTATAQEYNGAYFAPKGRSPAWKVQKRALTDAYRQKFGIPTASELADAKQRLGYTLPTVEDYEQAVALTTDPQAMDTLAQAHAKERALPAPIEVKPSEAQALLYESAAPQGPAPQVPVTPAQEASPETPDPAPHWSENPKVRSAFWARAHERGLTNADVHAALGVEHLRDYPGTLEQAGEAIKRYIEKKTGGGA